MKKTKIIYLILFFTTIIFGLLSRKIDWLPLATGDALYAVMVYWGFRFIIPYKERYYALFLSIVFCFLIEFLQLVQHPLFIEWRNNTFLKLILGQGFLWSDLIAYIIGAVFALIIDIKIIDNYSKRIKTKL